MCELTLPQRRTVREDDVISGGVEASASPRK